MKALRSSFAEVAAAIVAVVLVLAIVLATARTWPPAVIVESGSMMHDGDVPYGRYGTLDPGDIVLVRRVDGRADVTLPGEGGRERYGAEGDVIVFHRNDAGVGTPIIHRAVAWVEVVGRESDVQGYRVWHEGEWREFGPEGIAMPELDFARGAACCGDGRYRPLWSGFITKGDNPGTNPQTDQASLIAPQPVKLEWVKGKAAGEVPWIGLMKLAMSPDVNGNGDGWMRVGNAYAPRDLWAMLGVTLVALLVLPVAWDAVNRRIRGSGEDA